MKLLHAADIHLGRRRLDGRLPETDFRDAFARIADVGLRESVDVALLAGDLFDQAQVQPAHLRHAQDVLVRFRSAGIPVLAIEGNHDKGLVHGSQPTWLDYLADDNLLRLLTTPFGPDGPDLQPWRSDTRRGSFLDLHGIRFVGAGYLGAATPHKVRQIVRQLDPGPCHVLLLHAGPDYFVGEGGGFSRDDLEAIRSRVTYLALGHIHKPMIHDGWACNPGSPENCDLQEARYDRTAAGTPVPRGLALVEIDPSRPTPLVSVAIHSTPRRPVFELTLDCTPFARQRRHGMQSLISAAVQALQHAGPAPEAVILLRLTGPLHLARIGTDPDSLARLIEQEYPSAAVALDLSALNIPAASAAGDASPEVMPREQLERLAIDSLVEDQHLWGLDDTRPAITDLFYQLKEMIRTRRPTELIADHIAQSPLVEQVRCSTPSPESPPSPVSSPAPSSHAPDAPISSHLDP